MSRKTSIVEILERSIALLVSRTWSRDAPDNAVEKESSGIETRADEEGNSQICRGII